MKRLVDQTYYELLEINRSASPAEVERAYERAKALYGAGSLVAYTLLAPDDAEILSRRIEEARTILLEPEARASYDSRLPPEAAEPRPVRSAPPPAETPVESAPPPAPVAPAAPVPAQGEAAPASAAAEAAPPQGPPDGAPWTGELLRRAREGRGFTVTQIADRTKITRHHIDNIEMERYDKLPAPVYLRGILMSMARELRLDGQKVARSYLERAAGSQKPPGKHR